MKDARHIHRLVILPDFQGMRIGTKFLEAICRLYVDMGYKMYIRSAHVKLARHWSKSPIWRATARNGKCGEVNGINRNQDSVNRPCYSYEYVGEEFLKPHMEFAVDGLSDIDMAEMRKMLVELKKSNYLTIVHNKVRSESALNRLCRELGIRTELLYVHGKVSKKRVGERMLVSLKPGKKPVFGKVA
jgi:hypothetical protein